MKETKKYSLILALLIVGLIFFPGDEKPGEVGGAFFGPENKFPMSENRQELIPQLRFGVSDPEVDAKAVLVENPIHDITIYDHNSTKVLPIASLTKLMTALVVWEQMTPDEVVVVQSSDLDVLPNHAGLVIGEEVEMINLQKAMLISSANDATLALARSAGGTVDRFVAIMNEKAKEFGMENTSFTNPIGFDSPNHFSTAEDLGILVREFIKNKDLLSITNTPEVVFTSVDGNWQHLSVNTNELLGSYNVVGLKTGYTDEARGNLILLIDDGNIDYFSIILGSENRELAGEQVLKWIEESVEWK